MGDGIYVALSGAITQSTVLDTTAENLANASTDGYQRVRPVFREVLARTTAGAAPKVPHRFGVVAQTASDTTQGSIRTTGNALDFVLPQGAYLAVQTPQGERYTRAGSLAIAPDGHLVTSHGDRVLDEKLKPIKLPKDAVPTLTPGGDLMIGDDRVAHLRFVSFAKPETLVHEGSTRMAASAAAGAPRPVGVELQVGAVEESNAQVVSAMTDLVTASRTFEAFERAIEAFRDADRRVTTSVPNGD